MDALKTWLIEVALKKIGPTATAAGISALFGLLAAHQGLLEAWGITFGTWPLQWAAGSVPSGHVILIELDTISTGLLALLAAGAASIFAASQHHVVAAVTGAPQSGDVRTTPPQPVIGGERKDDPK